MGTFHDGLGELHGITVVVRAHDGRALIGRCHEATPAHVLLLDADVHRDGEGGLTTDAWIARSAKWGVFGKNKVLKLDGSEVASITPLGKL